MDKQRRVQEKGKDLIVQMQSVSESMKTHADKLTSALTSEIHKQFNTIFKMYVTGQQSFLFTLLLFWKLIFLFTLYCCSMQDKLTQNIKDIVAEQVKQGFKSHASVIEEGVMNAVRSRAVTPSPNIDSHVSIQIFILHQQSQLYYFFLPI